MFGLQRFKLHRHFVDGTVKSVWFMTGFRFTQGSIDGTVKSVWIRQVFGLLRVQYIVL